MRRHVLLVLAILFAVAVTCVPLYIDAKHEAAAALADFAEEQADAAELAGVAPRADLAAFEDQGSRIMLESTSGDDFRRPSGQVVTSKPLADAVARGDRTVRLGRADAAALGLPERTATAGIAHTRDGRTVVVVASALHLRDRAFRAQERLLLGIAIAALLAFGFGGIALWLQRKEHLLEHELVRREAEQRSEERLARADKLATMGAFATGIAHEIATPLGVISARAEMLSGRATDEKSTRAISAIVEQTEKIRGIIRTFLSLARGEPPARERIEPFGLLEQASRMVEHRFAAAGVLLDAPKRTDVPQVAGDQRLLEQALVNLLLNACDASRAGQRVSTRVVVSDQRVSFCVDDEGEGIAPDVAARATEPFFTTKAPGSGTGLGLVIANEIAKHHQGRFVIGPRVGGGTEARLELPAADPTVKERAA